MIYYLAQADMPVLAMLLFGKNEQANPTPKQRRAMVAMVEGEKAKRKRPASPCV